MVSWNEFYKRLKENVEKKIMEKEIFESQLNFSKIMGTTLKQCLEEEGAFKRRGIKRDDYKDVPDKQLLYRHDSKRKIKGEKG